MAKRLVIHTRSSTLSITSENTDKINVLSDFCAKELGAFRASEDADAFTIVGLSEEKSNKFYSLLSELKLL